MSQDFYADLPPEKDPVFILDHHFSFGENGSIDLKKVSRMCADASTRHISPGGWNIFPRHYAANDSQRDCQILMIRSQSNMTSGDPRPTREDAQFFRAFIKGWSACNARVRRKRP